MADRTMLVRWNAYCSANAMRARGRPSFGATTLEQPRLDALVWTLLVTAILFSWSACSVLADECTANDRRCNGAVIEECTIHPAGTDVSLDGPSVGHHD